MKNVEEREKYMFTGKEDVGMVEAISLEWSKSIVVGLGRKAGKWGVDDEKE